MRRRLKAGEVPAHLAAFVEADWPGGAWRDRFEFWRAARRVFAEEHGWPGGPLDRVAEESDVRRRREGQALLSWGRPWHVLAQLDPRHRRQHLARGQQARRTP